MKLYQRTLLVIDTFLLGVTIFILAFSYIFKATHFIYDMYMDIWWCNQMVVLVVISYLVIRLAHYTITKIVKEGKKNERL